MTEKDVGINAGNIFTLLSHKGRLTIREIGDHTHCRDRVIFMALGWLLRENKVRFSDRNGLLCVELNSLMVETSY
ncbi:winged helix-turn-helix domain-containing protein [Prevotella sp. 10(H)]|uniref:winged helix-turn-helix domain-containing protein n=1 Tax=Prevotella sp. 10(H) TaxID=1158294 RepID=UPI0004A76A96|nr:winged helix-turn-helix domain-containing protein [Prevotella sp. 10(H)]